MNALSENFKLNFPLHNGKKSDKNYLNEYSSFLKLSTEPISQAKVIYDAINNSDNINNLLQNFNELYFKYLKENQNHALENKENRKGFEKNTSKESLLKVKQESNASLKNKNTNSLSEIQKFKTELCHSWELTGTCKYGLNVIHIYIIN